MSTTSFMFRNLGARWSGAVLGCALLWCSILAAPARVAAQGSTHTPTPHAEIRALWVDAFHAGIRSAAEAEQLVADAKRAGANTLIVQVRRRGDALYLKSVEPPVEEPNYDPSFDALANIIEVAHRAGIEVHAWVNAMPVWRDQAPPRDARHVFNRHGETAQGDARWLTESPKGETKFLVGYFLDPGHPDAAAYLTEIYLNIVRNYAVDGIHFDYIRYPETAERLPRGAPVGYNARNLARFRAAHGKPADYMPDPGDQAFIEWRRKQVTQLVRRVYIEAKAIRPEIKISAALIPWGKPPTNEKDFETVAPMQRIFQDWHGWMKEGILDLAVPMNYAREHDPVVRGWFDGWIAWEKKHKHGRQLAVGIGAYVNTEENTLAQIERVRRKQGRDAADGVSFFSYANMFPATPPAQAPQQQTAAAAPVTTNAPAGAAAQAAAPSAPTPAGQQATAAVTPSANPADAAVRAGAAFPVAAPVAGSAPAPAARDRVAFLAVGAGERKGAFAATAPVPPMDWIVAPKTGFAAGLAKNADGAPDDGATIVLKRGFFSRARRIEADGNGWFGFTNVKPGKYKVWSERAGKKSAAQQIEVAAGKVARVAL